MDLSAVLVAWTWFEVFIIHRHGVGDSMTVICVFKAVYTVTFTKLCGFWTRIFPTLVVVPARKKIVRAAKLIFYLYATVFHKTRVETVQRGKKMMTCCYCKNE